MIPVNILIGRFQPLTNGHIKCIDVASEMVGAPTILCMINVPDNKVDPRHPFPSSMLLPIYQKIAQNTNIKDIIFVKNADIVKIAEQLRSLGYEPTSWTCGTDRFSVYLNMVQKYKEMAGLCKDFKVIEILRDDQDESATKLREALKNDDYETFFNDFPFGALNDNDKIDIFNQLRKQLLQTL